ncbi:MAG: hypothetical protein MHM6MM_006081 [Cercozoa sp. M6MM]
MSLSIREALAGQTLFITGCTGFVGKVVLEKVLRSVPDIKQVFILVRPRKNVTADERLAKIFDSQIWERLREERPDFDEWWKTKVFAAPGDVVLPNAGLSEAWQQRFRDEVNMVVHCAATIDFDCRLDLAVQLNVMGLLGLMNLASQCRDMRAFVHTVYPLEFDIDRWLEDVKKLTPAQLDKDAIRETGMLHGFPNTYCLTKNVAEQLALRKVGETGLPFSIVRPSMVGAAVEEPVPGWVDAIAAVGAGVFFAGVGFLRILHGNPENLSDIVPVDHVANTLLLNLAVTSQKHASCRQRQVAYKSTDVTVLHAATSGSDNPTTWGHSLRALEYFQASPMSKAIAWPHVIFIGNQRVYEGLFHLMYRAPNAVLQRLADSKLVGNEAMRKKAQLMSKVIDKLHAFMRAFDFFVRHEWAYDVSVRTAYDSELSPVERHVFGTSLTHMDWLMYMKCFCHGMATFVVKDATPFSAVYKRPSGFQGVSPALLRTLELAVPGVYSNRRPVQTHKLRARL